MKKITLIFGGLALGAAVICCHVPARPPSSAAPTTLPPRPTTGSAAATSPSATVRTNVCGECHTIHHAQSASAGPLFIHTPSANSTFNTYDKSGSATYSGTVITLGPGSLACLSCHDGSVAVNSTTSWSGAGNGTASYTGGTPEFIASKAIVTEIGSGQGNDLTHMHPIGVNYSAAASSAQAMFGVAQLQPTANTFNAPGSPSVGSVLKNGQIECSTCHDIHRTVGNSSGGIYTIASGQALCLGCHIK